jgi:D-inositol-3-phosphate glycosyltransferase
MRPRLLAIGQGVRPTGYARVLENILARLAGEFEVHLFALSYKGDPVDGPVRVLPNHVLGDPYGREQLPRLLEELRPNVVLIHHDPYMYAIHEPALSNHRPRTKVAVYCPIESAAVPKGSLTTLAGADLVVVYNEFGRGVVERSFFAADRLPSPITSIGHGVDSSVFRPLVAGDEPAARALARSRLWPDRPELRESFVVLNANRNGLRKKIDLTLAGFAEFARGRDDVYLYLHMGMRDRGLPLVPLIDELGIRERVIATTWGDAQPEVSDEHLNLVYNSCDVGLNTCDGEGWGLVAFEHGATGAPQVMPNHSACAELWRERALLLDADGCGVVAVDDVAAALERLYLDDGLRRELGAAARALTASPRFDWDLIADRWRHELLGILDAEPARPTSPIG